MNRMEYQKIINLLDNTIAQRSTFRTREWVEINDKSRGTYGSSSQIKLTITVLRSSLWNYSDSYIFAKVTITLVGEKADAVARAADRNSKQLILKYCALFTDCISKINNLAIKTQMYNLIRNSDNYAKNIRQLVAILQRWTRSWLYDRLWIFWI